MGFIYLIFGVCLRFCLSHRPEIMFQPGIKIMHAEENFVVNICYHSFYYDLENNNLKTRQMVQWVKFFSMNLMTRVQNLQTHIKNCSRRYKSVNTALGSRPKAYTGGSWPVSVAKSASFRLRKILSQKTRWLAIEDLHACTRGCTRPETCTCASSPRSRHKTAS